MFEQKKFAAILEAATYYSDRLQPTSLRFSQVLSGSIPLNVYAPRDAAISDAQYSQLLNEAQTDGWKLQQEFIFNHISPQENTSTSGSIVAMLNGKRIKKSTMNVLSTNSEAACGNLNILSAVLSYSPNMWEYLQEFSPNCGLAQQFIAETDTTYFDFAKSVSVPSMDGGMLILDSVLTHHNPLLDPFFMGNPNLADEKAIMCVKGFGENLADESASYKMVMPTDQVWNDAQAKLAPLYRYSERYVDKVKGDMNVSLSFYIDNPDSISALSIGAGILVPLLGKTSSEQKIPLSNGTAYAESAWPVPASEYKPDVEVEIEHSGTKSTTYREADGYTIIDIKNDTTISELEVQTQVVNVFYNTESTRYKVGEGSRCFTLNNNGVAEITNKYGRVSNNNFYYLFAPNLNACPKVEIKLQGKNGEQVMSGKYDVQVVIVPSWYIYLTENASDSYEIYSPGSNWPINYSNNFEEGSIPAEWRDPQTGQINEQVIDSIAAISKQKFKAQISYNNNTSKDKTTSGGTNTYDGLKVDTITIIEDFVFPYSYKNIRSSYPTLYIEGYVGKNDAKKGFIYDLVIDKVILKSKEDGSETEVTP